MDAPQEAWWVAKSSTIRKSQRCSFVPFYSLDVSYNQTTISRWIESLSKREVPTDDGCRFGNASEANRRRNWPAGRLSMSNNMPDRPCFCFFGNLWLVPPVPCVVCVNSGSRSSITDQIHDTQTKQPNGNLLLLRLIYSLLWILWQCVNRHGWERGTQGILKFQEKSITEALCVLWMKG